MRKHSLRELYTMPTVTLFTVLIAMNIRWLGNTDPLIANMARWIWTSQNHFICGYNEATEQTIIIELGSPIIATRIYVPVGLENYVRDEDALNINEFKKWVESGK